MTSMVDSLSTRVLHMVLPDAAQVVNDHSLGCKDAV